MEENGDMPTKLRKLDLSGNQEATEKVEESWDCCKSVLSKYPDTPVSYFEFVIDPNSFSQYCGEYILRFFHYKGWFCKNKA